jgi:carboxyl-terminal processing protease
MMPVRRIVGAGLNLGADAAGHGVRVTATRPGSPAAAAGIPAGSLVESIDGVPTAGKSLAECAALIRGRDGATVQIAISGPGDQPQKSVEVVRRPFFIDE